jgi:hypothetical protein
MLFTFPEDAHWNADRQAVEFGVEIGEYRGVVRVPRQVFQRLLPERPSPERCVEAYYLQRTRFESIAERKIRRRQLAEDGNVEISGRDLREGFPPRPFDWDVAIIPVTEEPRSLGCPEPPTAQRASPD